MGWLSKKCEHPAACLAVARIEPTVEPVDADFNHVTFHLLCIKCREPVKVKCASMIGGVDAFLARGRDAPSDAR